MRYSPEIDAEFEYAVYLVLKPFDDFTLVTPEHIESN